MPKYYAIKRPDGSWIMCFAMHLSTTWRSASGEDTHLRQFFYKASTRASAIELAEAAGYRCVEVVGFKEVDNG